MRVGLGRCRVLDQGGLRGLLGFRHAHDLPALATLAALLALAGAYTLVWIKYSKYWWQDKIVLITVVSFILMSLLEASMVSVER